MCSKNQEVGYLIRPIHNKRLFDSENFSSFAKFAFRTNDLYSKNGANLCKERTCSVFCPVILFEEGIVSQKNQSLFWLILRSGHGELWFQNLLRNIFLVFCPWVGETLVVTVSGEGQVRRRGVYEWSLEKSRCCRTIWMNGYGNTMNHVRNSREYC